MAWAATEHEYFNLVVQRVRTAGSELVEDQEIYRRVCITPSAVRCVREVLLESRLVRASGPLPDAAPGPHRRRPGRRRPPATRSPIPTATTGRR